MKNLADLYLETTNSHAHAVEFHSLRQHKLVLVSFNIVIKSCGNSDKVIII